MKTEQQDKQSDNREPKAPVGISTLVASAIVATERPRRRGEVCRGAYVCDPSGRYYLTHGGEWTDGVKGDENWWDNERDARKAILKQQEATSEAMPPGVKL